MLNKEELISELGIKTPIYLKILRDLGNASKYFKHVPGDHIDKIVKKLLGPIKVKYGYLPPDEYWNNVVKMTKAANSDGAKDGSDTYICINYPAWNELVTHYPALKEKIKTKSIGVTGRVMLNTEAVKLMEIMESIFTEVNLEISEEDNLRIITKISVGYPKVYQAKKEVRISKELTQSQLLEYKKTHPVKKYDMEGHLIEEEVKEEEKPVIDVKPVVTKKSTRQCYEHDGVNLTLKQWSTKTGIPYGTLYQRLHILHWSFEKTITTIDKKPKKV